MLTKRIVAGQADFDPAKIPVDAPDSHTPQPASYRCQSLDARRRIGIMA